MDALKRKVCHCRYNGNTASGVTMTFSLLTYPFTITQSCLNHGMQAIALQRAESREQRAESRESTSTDVFP